MNSKHLAKGSRKPLSLTRGHIRLYSNRFCPYCQRVILVLDAKGIPYDVVNINLANKPEWLYDKVPGGRIPALEIDSGEVLYESIVISEYLDDKYPHNRLQARDPLMKAKDQLLLRKFTKLTGILIKSISLGRIDDDEEDIITEGMTFLENELRTRRGPFFDGNKPGMLDLMIWPWCERSDVLKMYGKGYILKSRNYKQLMEWRDEMLENDAVKKSSCDTNTHIQYLNSYKAGIPNYDLLYNL